MPLRMINAKKLRIANKADVPALKNWFTSPEYLEFCQYTPLHYYGLRLGEDLESQIVSQKGIFIERK